MRLLSKVAALILIGFLLGSVHNTTPKYASQYARVTVSMHVAPDAAVAASASFWRTEVSRRFPNAVVIICHGGDINGVWYMFPADLPFPVRAADYMASVRKAVPIERPIVMVTCNPGGHCLGIPGVFHAMDNVWFVPDKSIPEEPDQIEAVKAEPTWVGNIYEFTDL